MNKSIIFFDTSSHLINPNDDYFFDKELVELFINKEDSIDEELTKIITTILQVEEYTNIIIPVCFGDILSDFIGLRLATHIRCTPGINQLSNIFLYSFTGIQDYFSSECFNILKTKGVSLIDYDIKSILNHSLIDTKYLSENRLLSQVKKLKLDVPLNYEDSHSIANEWAIYRWSKTIGTFDDEIQRISSKLKNDLYFKYLKTIYSFSEFEVLQSQDLKLNFEGSPTVLYIDDEAEKGWKEIFEKILIDENDIDLIHHGVDLNEKQKEEIVEFSLNQVISEDVDLVILDFRLHRDDFQNIPIDEITGFQILKKIKEYNRGIQVIIFSATNKIWNLQALQEAGADDFILKESPENTIDSSFTKQSIENMLIAINDCLKNDFLKDFYRNHKKMKSELNPRKEYEKSPNPLPKEFVDEVIKWSELNLNILQNKLNQESLTAAFLIYFSIIENISNRVIEIENPIYENGFYKFQFRKNLQRLNNFIEDENNEGYYRKTNSKYKSKKGNLPWAIKIYNTLDFIIDNQLKFESINELVQKRNKIIHLNSTMGDIIDVQKSDIILLNKVIYKGLSNII